MRTKTYDQLTLIFQRFRRRELSAYHPIISDLVKYEDILDELSEMREDLECVDPDDIEERKAIVEEIVNLPETRVRSLMVPRVDQIFWNSSWTVKQSIDHLIDHSLTIAPLTLKLSGAWQLNNFSSAS